MTAFLRSPRHLATAAVLIVAAATVAVASHASGATGGHTAEAKPAATSTPATTGDEVAPTEPPTTWTAYQHAISTVPNTTGVSGVIAYDTKGYPAPGTADAGTVEHNHVAGQVRYSVVPPVGGPHSGTWMNAGVYDVPIPAERAVHNLEHGAVWIMYRPDISASDLAALYAFVDRQTMISEGNRGPNKTPQANRFVDVSPYTSNGLVAPIVISSWGYQLRVSSPADPRLQQFIDTFRHTSRYTPEMYEPVDGVGIHVGGNPARDGSLAPNPA